MTPPAPPPESGIESPTVPPGDRFAALHARIGAFVAARDWARFHNPKNLAMALVAEAGELAAELQWLTPAEADALDPAKKEAVAMEMADVLIYLIELGDRLGVDPLAAAGRKLDRNEVRYPVEKAFGNAKKYDEL
jgi:NTP pyrophosphatase (non-canonical NTP hydrolase)